MSLTRSQARNSILDLFVESSRAAVTDISYSAPNTVYTYSGTSTFEEVIPHLTSIEVLNSSNAAHNGLFRVVSVDTAANTITVSNPNITDSSDDSSSLTDVFIGLKVVYDDSKNSVPDGIPASPWARVLVRHLTGSAETLADRAGIQEFIRRGLLTVQIFTPPGDGLQSSVGIAESIADNFEGRETQGNVWFQNLTVNEIAQDGAWFQTNILSDFLYFEAK